MSTALTRRLGKLEHVVRDERAQRLHAGARRLMDTLTSDHLRTISTWILRPERTSVRCTEGHSALRCCPRCLDAAAPPALVRALWILLFEHMERGTPVALAPEVAQVYINHPDALPEHPCLVCGYLLPARSGNLAFTGRCPSCCVAVTDRCR